MHLGSRARRVGFLLTVLVLAATACSATENVTINQDAVASATSTAVRNDATAGAEPSATAEPEPATPTATATPAEGSNDPTDADDQDQTAVAGADGDCSFAFIDSFGDIQIELAFTSRLAERDDASARYEVYDGNGDLIAESSHFFEELAPGEQVRIAVDTLTEEPTDRGARSGITCALIEVEPTPVGFETFTPGANDTCRFVEIDGFGDIQIELSVVSPLTEVSELAIDYALRGQDGIRFADGVNFTLEVGPGETSLTPTDTFAELPDWVTESSLSCEVLSIQGF